MSSNKLDIEQLRTNYPFLTKIWELHEEFERSVDDEDKRYRYENICKAKLGPTNMKYEKYVNFCIKLIRNLISYYDYARVDTPSAERCKILNYWIYYNIDDLNFSQKFISDIFKESQDLTIGYTNKSTCPNLYIETLKESEKILKLLYLQDNIKIFLKILKNKGDNDYCSCEKYIYECVDIYNSMSNSYCLKEDDRLNKQKKTCDTLNTFKDIYMNYLYNEEDMSNKIPSLIDDNTKI
ncbi:hypothetical protein PCYB_003880 [Plasmodium cynomolgi strain B]|uniref:CYIR protein n=1 Tax=Plasmodium cynomolgi (strain B) TaxID=1120755 RepID=K6V040_PLACD|nr:hypothetical protein PCYB_003880 [Plasmodium cynomolgi strain B]GAB69639.1 hypothetical protein PCYB_003880 [Plasmodium cynomolgi strain B]